MIRIAVDTARSQGSIAVGRGARVLMEVSIGTQTRHAETALPALDAALEMAGVDRDDVGGVVVGSGPGSFTGVRVAGATAKGLAAGLDVPLLAFPSLLALAASVPAAGPVCGLFDARRGEVYAGCWRVSAPSIEEVLSPRVAPLTEVLDAMAGTAPLYAGDGAARHHDALVEAGAAVATLPAWPRASALLWLAEHHGEAGAVADAGVWEPGYVRASSAERGVKG